MSNATDIIEEATNPNNRNLDKSALTKLLESCGVEPDQDWDEQTTTWTFEDDSAIRDCNGEIHAYGQMPNTNDIDWYLVSQ